MHFTAMPFFYVDNIFQELVTFCLCLNLYLFNSSYNAPFIDLIYDLSTKWEAFIKPKQTTTYMHIHILKYESLPIDVKLLKCQSN